MRASIAAAIASFPGLAHRMEDVGRIGKVRFVNDSKATNADAAARALVCFPDIFWIAGGKPKEGGIEPLAPYLPAHPQGLSDRRSGGAICRHARRQGAVRRCRGTLEERGCCQPRATPQRRQASQRRWFCCRRPALRSTSSRISSSAATSSAHSWPSCAPSRCGRRHEFSAPTAAASPDWWWTIDRVALAAHARADRHRPDAGLRRQSGRHRRTADRRRFPLCRSSRSLFAGHCGRASSAAHRCCRCSRSSSRRRSPLPWRLDRLVPRACSLEPKCWARDAGSISECSALQPSEFLKPGFAVLGAAISGRRARRCLCQSQ